MLARPFTRERIDVKSVTLQITGNTFLDHFSAASGMQPNHPGLLPLHLMSELYAPGEGKFVEVSTELSAADLMERCTDLRDALSATIALIAFAVQRETDREQVALLKADIATPARHDGRTWFEYFGTLVAQQCCDQVDVDDEIDEERSPDSDDGKRASFDITDIDRERWPVLRFISSVSVRYELDGWIHATGWAGRSVPAFDSLDYK